MIYFQNGTKLQQIYVLQAIAPLMADLLANIRAQQCHRATPVTFPQLSTLSLGKSFPANGGLGNAPMPASLITEGSLNRDVGGFSLLKLGATLTGGGRGIIANSALEAYEERDGAALMGSGESYTTDFSSSPNTLVYEEIAMDVGSAGTSEGSRRCPRAGTFRGTARGPGDCTGGSRISGTVAS